MESLSMRLFPKFFPLLLFVFFEAGAQAAPPKQVVQPDFSTCTLPVYPPEAKARKDEGSTTLAVLVGPDGVVRKTVVRKSSGYADLDEAARTSLGSCRYRTALVDGKPVEVWTMIAYVWTMDGAGKKTEGAP
jgi:TonB family protein